MFFEVIYETGASSVLEGEEEEVISGLEEQQRRANSGEAGGPDGHPAERIKRVLVYDVHPNEFNPGQTLTPAEAKSVVADFAKEHDPVSVPELIQHLQMAVHPMQVTGPHESNFKMTEQSELAWSGE